MTNKILNGLKRLLYGETYCFTTRKGSTSLSGASWVPIFTEMTETPMKLISIEFLKESTNPVEYRIVVNNVKIFPFGDFSNFESGASRNFLIPISISAGEYLQIEIRGSINDKSVVIMSELALIEVV